ncbi:MAG: radical SAM protein [Clostridia bacterium]|nr:radical SAM protein [Clostridia bacterium]
MKKRNTYLAIAITTYCNYQCFYCKEGGESISSKRETIPFSKIKKVIDNAYNVGITNFRITGGEPTRVSYFSELIEFIMSFEDTKIRINTNGHMILKHINVLAKYKKRLDVVFSVDSISENLNGVHFPKFLSDNVINITQILKENGISVRYNIVVTSLNECEVKELVIKAIDELKVNVKLLDLNKFSEYLGYVNKIIGEEAFDLWNELFVPMKNFYSFLEDISSDSKSEWTTGLISKGHGIPMSSYFRGENWIQVKDSTRGAKYSEFCKRECEYFKARNCQEGVFSLFLSSNLILHLSGCKNESIQFDLREYGNEQIRIVLENLLCLIQHDF